MATETTTVRATQKGAEALRRLAITLSAQVGRRISIADVLEAAVTLATRDPDATIAALPGGVE